MKKIILPVLFALTVSSADAQLTLTGTSYTQNFDGIGGGLPTGWSCYKNASSVSLGTLDTYSGSTAFGAYYDTTNCPADVFGHGFKNCASATASTSTSTCAQQQAIANRALGVRQVSSTSYPGYDPGCAFVLHLANTSGYSAFNLSFKLQGLDILSARVTTWSVDYGFGASPATFTAATPVGITVTGGSQFTNNTITVNFGSALDNQSQDVWIRVVALNATSGSGNRTTSAIDDYTLSYANTASVNNLNGNNISFFTLGQASENNITFRSNVGTTGVYNLAIYDITGRMVYARKIELSAGSPNDLSVNDINLVPGIYVAQLSGGNSSRTTKVTVQ